MARAGVSDRLDQTKELRSHGDRSPPLSSPSSTAQLTSRAQVVDLDARTQSYVLCLHYAVNRGLQAAPAPALITPTLARANAAP
jgi:hypothetical protein